jgi:putative membrane protein
VEKKLPFALLGTYLLIFGICAISPHDRAVWWAENVPIMLLVAVIVWVARTHTFTGLSYFFMSFLIVLHTIGGHFTFELVPFGYVTDFFGFERNHYDRMAHFTVGFFAYPIAEVMHSREMARSKAVLLLFPVFTIVAVAAGYEILEWLYAISADPEAGIAVLGSQGDIWDAQKDMLADSLGAFFAIGVFAWVNRSRP